MYCCIVFQSPPNASSRSFISCLKQEGCSLFIHDVDIATSEITNEVLSEINNRNTFWALFKKNGGMTVNAKVLRELIDILLLDTVEIRAKVAELSVFEWCLMPWGSSVNNPCLLYFSLEKSRFDEFLATGTRGVLNMSGHIKRIPSLLNGFVLSEFRLNCSLENVFKFVSVAGENVVYRCMNAMREIEPGVIYMAKDTYVVMDMSEAMLNTEEIVKILRRSEGFPIMLPFRCPNFIDWILENFNAPESFYTESILSQVTWCGISTSDEMEETFCLYGKPNVVSQWLRRLALKESPGLYIQALA